MITSKIDYCNSVFLGFPKTILSKLQLILNKAARLIVGIKPWDRITPILIALHWLPITARIEYKVCLLVFKTLKFRQPAYLCDLLIPYQNNSELSLRSSDVPYRLLEPSAVNHRVFAERVFSYTAPRLYNGLPVDIKSLDSTKLFKTKLKTHIFGFSYDTQTLQINPKYKL